MSKKLISLCNYYDTTDFHIIENTENEDINNMLDEIKSYYENTPREVIDKVWEEIEAENHVGPSVSDYETYLSDIERKR